MSGSATVGWCPGALRPMVSGDGLLLRVKPRGGRLSLDQAATIATLAQRFGNGQLDLTGRANLQIRGVRPDTYDPLLAGLRDADLLDADAGTEALRNVVASPLAGFDATAYDIGPFLDRLETCLATEPELRTFPAKWSFVVDGGGFVPLYGVPADVSFRFDRIGRTRIGLGALWSEPLTAAPDLRRFLNGTAALVAAEPRPCRMSTLLEARGAAAVFRQLGFRLASEQPLGHSAMAASSLLGLEGPWVQFAPAFAGLLAQSLTAAVTLCRRHDVRDLRLTPWRVLIATGSTDRGKLAKALASLGFISMPDDPRLGVTACVGAPACHRATSEARGDAALVAKGWKARQAGSVHVSGCGKLCARPSDTAWTLVAHDGRYAILHGRDPVPHVTGLSSTEAANWLSRAESARTL